MRHLFLALLLATAAACGDTPPGDVAPPAREYEVAATVLENGDHGPELCLGAMLESYPPQCGGVPVRNWDWDLARSKESSGRTTWGEAILRGTYDGNTFTVIRALDKLTNPPPRREHDFSAACPAPEATDPSATTDSFPGFDDPEVAAVWLSRDRPAVNVVVRPGSAARIRPALRSTYKGPLCLVERDQRPRQELATIQDRVTGRLGDQLLSAAVDEVRGVVVASVIVATPELQADLDREFGPGTVELEGRLIPVG